MHFNACDLKDFAITSAESRGQAVNTHSTIKKIKENYQYFNLEMVQDAMILWGRLLDTGRLWEGRV